MIFPRQLAVCLLDVVRAGITSHAENLVIVLVFHGEVASVSEWMIGNRADRIALSRRRNDRGSQCNHSITSARSRSDCGIVSPSAFAVLALITSSNFVGCSMGRSPGFAPLSILSTYCAPRRDRSARC